MRLAGIASATVSKLATAVPPRFLISSTTSSAGAALEPEPSDAPPGSLTTTLAPSAAQSSAISRPMPRPAPVTMMTLPSSDLAMESAPVDEGLSLPFVRKHDRPTRGEHAADAVTYRNLCVLHLRRRDAAHLAHALLQRVHAVHARMHVGEAAAIGVERQFPARPRVAVGDELAGLFIGHEAEITEAEQRQMRKGVVDHEVIDVLVCDAGLLEGERTCHLE